MGRKVNIFLFISLTFIISVFIFSLMRLGYVFEPKKFTLMPQEKICDDLKAKQRLVAISGVIIYVTLLADIAIILYQSFKKKK